MGLLFAAIETRYLLLGGCDPAAQGVGEGGMWGTKRKGYKMDDLKTPLLMTVL